MSETDDTDVLLLIPPNFFLVPSSGSEDSLLDSSRTVVHKAPSCTAQVVGKLFNQVYDLENRLESLEISAASDTLSSRRAVSRFKTLDSSKSFDSSDRKYSTFPRRRRKRNSSKRRRQVLSPTSVNSADTYSKQIPRLKFETIEPAKSSTDSIVDDLPSMDGDLSSIISTPSKKNDRLLLNEIDEFLTKVETYESPESKYRDQESELSPENVIKAASDYITNKLDVKNVVNEEKQCLSSNKTVPSNVLNKYIYLVNNNANKSQAEKPLSENKSQNSNESRHDVTPKTSYESTKISRDSKSPGVRKLNFADTNKDVQPTSTPKQGNQACSYLDSFRPSSNKIYDRASKVLEQYKAQSYSRTQNSIEAIPQKEEFKRPYLPDTHRPCNTEPKRQYNSENQKPSHAYQHSQRLYDIYKPIDMKEGPKLGMQSKFLDTIDTELLSLSDLWGERKNGVEKVDSVKLEEERMKREHCEAIIQELQRKLLEQQERLAVAIKVDRSKDIAITKLKEAWLRVTSSLDKAEERHRTVAEKLSREMDNFRQVADDAQRKTNHFETELYKALDLAHDYQEKCKQLAIDKRELQESLDKQLAERDDVISSKERDLASMRENFEAVMRLNKQSSDCVKNVDDALEKEKQEHESTRLQLSELNRKLQTVRDETDIVMRERDVLREKVNEGRARCNMLESQLAEKQNFCSELMRKCDALDNDVKCQRRQLELQKQELKSYYQKQLEDAVLAKLQEFQIQLDRAERDMENENKSKENAIVDTFNKQMARVEEQHKLEVNVLEEKHKEEIKLYRLQLAQSGEKVSLLESKLESHAQRRGELARQLHAVMQAQWRQALGILTHTPRDREHTASTPEATEADHIASKFPPLSMCALSQRGVTSSRRDDARMHTHAHTQALDGLSDTEMQQYVKLLLTKPPQFDTSADSTREELETRLKSKDLNEEPTSDRPEKDKEKKDKAKRSLNLSKPPWKS